MLEDFAHEFESPTEPADVLGRRVASLLERDEAIVPLARDADGRGLGFGILIPRSTSFLDGRAAMLEELYVVPERRDHGIGSRLLELAIEAGRERGVGFFEIGVDESDVDTQRFYGHHGFTNREGPDSEGRMFYFEREFGVGPG
ncbi:GNAT family N-acetyltransferase [Thermoleophilia bacterium SCSIO 60948]|nr:GNAT family N-acetyltransferase [Thermoleophilia bacterium SCSIO 60948]